MKVALGVDGFDGDFAVAFVDVHQGLQIAGAALPHAPAHRLRPEFGITRSTPASPPPSAGAHRW